MKVTALVERLASVDVQGCAGSDEVAGLVGDVGRVRAWLDAFEARCISRAGELAHAVLVTEGRRRGREASTVVARAAVCEEMPSLHEALAEGVVSAGHVDAVARTAGGLSPEAQGELRELEPVLVAAAVGSSVEAFERSCRDLGRLLTPDEGVSRQAALRRQRKVKRWVDRTSGMHKTLLELDPLADAAVGAALHAATLDARSRLLDPTACWDHVQADALVDLITGARAVDRRVPEVSVVVDLDTLESGLHDRSVCETSAGAPLPPATVRRLAYDADVVPTVLGCAGEVLDEGRASRLATPPQRRAIRAMHRTCVMPDCDVPVDACRIHHVDPWQQGGRTDLDSLVPVCEQDHHRLHEGGWSLKIRPDRSITVTSPTGEVTYEGPSNDRTGRPP
jgi:hypothetical protein